MSRVVLAAAGVGAACSSSPQLVADRGLEPGFSETGGSTFTGRGGTGGGGTSAFDDSPVVRAPRTPPHVSGGTLLALNGGGRFVVADSDRDRISIVDVAAGVVETELALDVGAEPGRLVEDAAGRVHVALRGTGELVDLDPLQGKIVSRRAVCAAPRGVAYDRSTDSVLVACVEGTLVELPAAGGAPSRVTRIAPDLRDVLVTGDRVVVTLFREATLLFLDAERAIEKRVKLPSVDGFAADVAWRATALADGSVAVVHQRAFEGRINVSGAGGSPGAAGTSGTGGTATIDVSHGQAGASVAGAPAEAEPEAAGGEPGTTFEPPQRDGYGSTVEPCSAVVVSALSHVSPSGEVTTGPNLAGILPVDVAVSGDGHWAVAFAGGGVRTETLGVYTGMSLPVDPNGSTCLLSTEFASGPAIVAVAFDPRSNLLVAQRREDATLVLMDLTMSVMSELALGAGADAVTDTGHQLFHLDAGGGLACASCHPEGTDDGRVWNFSDFGERRTQPLDVGLFGTAPFHWDASLASFGDLMEDIFRNRMGGPLESPERAEALEEYVYALPRRPATRAADDPGALRGKALFESRGVGCASCHAGTTFTNGASADIGRGTALQVPSLIGVSTRAPYMHDGCAATLLDRFDPKCGGSKHGSTGDLSADQIADLVAYLETL